MEIIKDDNVKNSSRHAVVNRETFETKIHVEMDLDNYVRSEVKTGSGFLDHMLDLFQVHSGTTLKVHCEGDTHIDLHHSVEDIGLCIGKALNECLSDKTGINRFGFFYVPMEDALARVVIDLSGRYGFSYNVDIDEQIAEGLTNKLIKHFFNSLAENGRFNLHIDLLKGEDVHHAIESVFKAFARSLKMAIAIDKDSSMIPSSKGYLE